MMQVEVPTTLTTSPSRQPAPMRVPVRIEGADRDGDAGLQPEFLRPFCGKMAGEMVGGEVLAVELFAHAVKQRIDLRQETLRRQAAPLGVPHPLVAHGADAALRAFADR